MNRQQPRIPRRDFYLFLVTSVVNLYIYSYKRFVTPIKIIINCFDSNKMWKKHWFRGKKYQRFEWAIWRLVLADIWKAFVVSHNTPGKIADTIKKFNFFEITKLFVFASTKTSPIQTSCNISFLGILNRECGRWTHWRMQ